MHIMDNPMLDLIAKCDKILHCYNTRTVLCIDLALRDNAGGCPRGRSMSEQKTENNTPETAELTAEEQKPAYYFRFFVRS